MNHESPPRRLPPAVGALLLLVVGVGFAALLLAGLNLLAGFFVARQAGPAIPDQAGDTVAHTLAYLDINPAPLVPDVDLLWRNEPGARRVRDVNPRPWGVEPKWAIDNNSEGFRGPEREQEAPAYRILCVGDSITFGFNADQPDSYPAQLLALLRDRYPGKRIEVINAGASQYSSIL